MQRIGTALAILLTITSSARAGTLYAALPAGFIVGNAANNGHQSIEERVPAGETVDHWTRMITILWFAELGPKRDAMLSNFEAVLAQACPGSRHDPLPSSDGIVRFDCPMNPGTGLPETMFARVFEDGADIRMVQVAFRSVPSKAEEQWASAYLTKVAFTPN